MKVTLHEYAGCFSIELIPETMVELAKLCRFGAYTTKELRHAKAYIETEGSSSATIVVGKHKRAGIAIPKLK